MSIPIPVVKAVYFLNYACVVLQSFYLFTELKFTLFALLYSTTSQWVDNHTRKGRQDKAGKGVFQSC